MTTTLLLENSILADLAKDPNLSQYPLRNHDYGGRKAGDDIYPDSLDEQPAVTTVTAHDQGEFVYGSAIHKFRVEVQVVYNGIADNFNGQLIDTLADAASSRMQASTNLVGGTGREDNFSTSQLKVYGIMRDLPGTREDSGFQRIRTVYRTFIAAKIAGIQA